MFFCHSKIHKNLCLYNIRKDFINARHVILFHDFYLCYKENNKINYIFHDSIFISAI